MSNRYTVHKAVETMEGDGVVVNRLFPVAGTRNHDPFVLWDHFDLAGGHGFPTHPHRGFEAITYLFSGSMQHADNLGNESTVGTGGAQRFTAGRGIVHSEMPGNSENTSGIQLWINLPQRLKQIEPAYQAVHADEFSSQEWDGGWRRDIVGAASPLELKTAVEYFELKLDSGGEYRWQPDKSHRGLIYVVEGSAGINGQQLDSHDAMLVDEAEPLVFTSKDGARLMVCFGHAHGEPIYQHGPYVD